MSNFLTKLQDASSSSDVQPPSYELAMSWMMKEKSPSYEECIRSNSNSKEKKTTS